MNLLFYLYWIAWGVTILHSYEASPLQCVFVRSVLVKRMSCEEDACTLPAKKSKVEQDRKGSWKPRHTFIYHLENQATDTPMMFINVCSAPSVLLYVRKECDEVFDALMLHSPTLTALMEAVRMSFYCLNGDIKHTMTLWLCWTSSTDLREVFGPSQQNQSISKEQERVSWHVELFILLSESLFRGWNWSIFEYSCVHIRKDFLTWLLS